MGKLVRAYYLPTTVGLLMDLLVVGDNESEIIKMIAQLPKETDQVDEV